MKEKKQKRKLSKKKRIFYDILMVIAAGVFLFSAYKLGSIYYLNYKEGKEKDRIQQVAKVPKDPEKEAFSIDWEALRQTNEQVMGWILIPDTNISYPIVQGEDNDYYLHNTFEHQVNYAGAIFLDANANSNFEDKNTFIYGHNVIHGTMFAELEKFREQDFFEQHPYIYLFTPTQNYRLEIQSFYQTTADSPSYVTQFGGDEQFQQYLELILNNSDFKRESTMGVEDHLITLSTCSYERNGQPSDLRYLLHAKLVAWQGSYMVEETTE